MRQENGNKLRTEEKTGYEDTCDFILPQLRVSSDPLTKTEGKDIFPFEVTFKQSKTYHRPQDANLVPSPPSTIPSLPLIRSDDNEESVPEDVRYIRDVFSSFQGFIENIGLYYVYNLE
jgi:hypothetical protein